MLHNLPIYYKRDLGGPSNVNGKIDTINNLNLIVSKILEVITKIETD